EGDILLLEAVLNSEPSPLPSFKEELKAYEAQTVKSSVDESPEVELKDMPHYLEYAFLEGDDKLPVIIAKELRSEEKAALIKVLKSHKRAIAWKLSDIQGINPEFCTHKILMEEDYKPAVQHQRRADTSHPNTSSIPLPSLPTAPIPPVTQIITTPIGQYSRRARIAQSSALPTVADEPASPVRDVSKGEAYPTESGFIADQDRATIAKSSTLPHDSAPRVTSPAADKGSMQQTISELTALCTSLQRQHSELLTKFQAQEVEILRLKERVQVLEDKESVAAKQSGDDAPIKGRSINKGEAAAERISNDTEEIARVLTSMDATTVLAGGIDVPTSSGSIPTASPIVTSYSRRKGKEVMVESDTLKKQRLQKQIDAQENYSKVYKFQSQQRRPVTKKQKRDYYMTMIRNNLGWKVKYFKGMTFEEIEAKFAAVWKHVEDFIPMSSKEETERLKRKGFNLEPEHVKKKKTSEEAPEIEKSTEEIPKEKMKEVMQLVPVEEVYVQALQVKHPIIDWKVHTEGQRSYWKIISLSNTQKKLNEAPILIAHDWDMPFELICDASDFAIGTVLGKRQEKHFRPIHYASKTMTEAESNYTTTEKEMLAVVFRTPRAIISDQRTHFCNDQFAKVMLKFGVTHRLATPYHPQTSGQVEVSNRGLKCILERTVGENHASWSDKLDDALWAFRTAYKTPIRFTPYKLIYGLACHLPIELEHKAYWALKHANFDLQTTGDHKKVQLKELNELHDQAYENSLIYKEKTKRIHDSKIKDRVFNIGDRVLLFNSRLKILSGKLKSRWSEPFTISHVFPYGTVELSQPDGPNFKVNGHRLKHYFGDDVLKIVVPDLQTFPKKQ
nr:reverse transcriptase domain-containing protein [Tanacetum cinerariifolium]